jgi:hypothetical protein
MSAVCPAVTRATGESKATGDAVKTEGFNQVTDRTAASFNFAAAVDIPGVGGKGASASSSSLACVGYASKCLKP